MTKQKIVWSVYQDPDRWDGGHVVNLRWAWLARLVVRVLHWLGRR